MPYWNYREDKDQHTHTPFSASLSDQSVHGWGRTGFFGTEGFMISILERDEPSLTYSIMTHRPQATVCFEMNVVRW